LPVRDSTPKDDQPLARPVNEQPLARPAGGEQAEPTQAESHEAEEAQTAPQAQEASQGEKGPVTRIMNKAQENNWVYDTVAEKARDNGLLDKADDLLARAKNRLSSG
jgi:hypothetical protein